MLEINNLLRHARQKIVSYVLPITGNVWNVKKAIIEMKFCFIEHFNLEKYVLYVRNTLVQTNIAYAIM